MIRCDLTKDHETILRLFNDAKLLWNEIEPPRDPMIVCLVVLDGVLSFLTRKLPVVFGPDPIGRSGRPQR